ncbi:MAG: FAD:protein FMN transferase [Eubacteriales bacterium]
MKKTLKSLLSSFAPLAISAVLALFPVLLTSCSVKPTQKVTFAMGSVVSQTVYGGDGGAAEKANKAIAELDGLISYRDEDSEIAKLNKDKTAFLSDNVLKLVRESLELSSDTAGMFDITVLPLVKVWGFDGDSPALPAEEEISSALESVGFENIIINESSVTLKNSAALDLSALGKGLACEAAVNEYKKAGATGGIVSVGGSVGVYGLKTGGKPFTVGIRDPFDVSSVIGTLTITNTFISTSGSYEKKFEKDGKTYHHLLDPKTGYPAYGGCVSVTVVCGDGGLSDALASACFCLGIEKSQTLLEKYSAEAVFITDGNKIFITSGLTGVFETPLGYEAAYR